MSRFHGRFTTRCLPTLAALLFVLVFSLSAAAQKPGLFPGTIESGKVERHYLLHIPTGYDSKQKKLVPLVLMLHGRSGNAELAASEYYGWRPLADKQGFVVVFPEALGKPTSWDGAYRGKPTADSIFLAELIDKLMKELHIDRDRVFMTGHSSGGFMSYSFAATHPEMVAAIGPVAGLRLSIQEPKLPVSIISFHGMADDVVAYDEVLGKNAAFKGMTSAPDSISFFADKAGAKRQEREASGRDKWQIHIDRWLKGRDETEFVLYSIEAGDHGWPRGGSRSVEATKLIWDFFVAHPRPTAKKKDDIGKTKAKDAGKPRSPKSKDEAQKPVPADQR